jgi:uncharacterized protein (TIGR00730 family)
MAAGNPRYRRRYATGDPDLDSHIDELVQASLAEPNNDLLRELLTSCLRLVRQGSDRGELKLVNAALKEFVYSFRVFNQYSGVRKIAVFGSARLPPDDANYECARQFSLSMAERGWMVITGAGGGIMEAGHAGAGAERSFGASIRLPTEAPNEVIGRDSKLINFKYFFTRKVTFVKESDAAALFPGGYGTMDEVFEVLTLMQTGKSDIRPVVLVEAEGSTYWHEWQSFVERGLAARGLIDAEDTSLYHIADGVEDALGEIERFYNNYHSQRWVRGKLVLRVQRTPPARELERLSTAFGDLLGPAGVSATKVSPEEKRDNDRLELERLAVDLARRHPGRLRQLIDALNEF